MKEGRTKLDLLFEVLPKFRIPYSAKIEGRMLAGKKVFFVDDNRLAACFDASVGTETIEEMAKAKPWIAVMRDASMADDATQANFAELFRTYSPDTHTPSSRCSHEVQVQITAIPGDRPRRGRVGVRGAAQPGRPSTCATLAGGGP